MLILAIDPGNTESAYALIEMPNFSIVEKGKLNNEDLKERLPILSTRAHRVAIEMIASYGMPVGREVFETCVWIGRFMAASARSAAFVYRMDEKMALCYDARANDATIKRALIDRYAKHDLRTGKGTKKNPDTFFDVSKDVWQAIAVGVTFYEKGATDEQAD